MVCDVLFAFSLPNALGQSYGTEEGAHGGKMSVTMLESIHALVMWFVIPPVIASMFASYSMFGFVSVLHVLDVFILMETMGSCADIVARFQKRMKKKLKDDNSAAKEKDGGKEKDGSGKDDDGDES